MSEHEATGDSRRSFMAKSALATGALALGTAGFGTATVSAQDDRVAIFSNNYYPGGDFDVIAQLQASTTVDVLQFEGETVPEISQPDEWGGHIIRYDIGPSGITTFLFVRGQSLSEGDSGTIGEEASVLNSDLNLLNTTLNGGETMEDTEPEEDDTEENVTEEDDVTEDDNLTEENDTAIGDENATANGTGGD